MIYPIRNPLIVQIRFALFVLGCMLYLCCLSAAAAKLPSGTPESVGMSSSHLALLDGVITRAIGQGRTPGAVVLVARRGTVVYRKAFGQRALLPLPVPMTVDTVFDMASLTKVMAGTPAIMLLLERGSIRLTDTLAQYVPDFAAHGKKDVTLRQMLTHYSGLRPDLDMEPHWTGYRTAIQKAFEEKLSAIPGEKFIYSDINFFS